MLSLVVLDSLDKPLPRHRRSTEANIYASSLHNLLYDPPFYPSNCQYTAPYENDIASRILPSLQGVFSVFLAQPNQDSLRSRIGMRHDTKLPIPFWNINLVKIASICKGRPATLFRRYLGACERFYPTSNSLELMEIFVVSAPQV